MFLLSVVAERLMQVHKHGRAKILDHASVDAEYYDGLFYALDRCCGVCVHA